MTATTHQFDTLDCSNKLKAAGFSERQAETTTKILSEALTQVGSNAATKRDLKEALKQLEVTLTLRMGGMLVAAIALAPLVLKIYHIYGII